MNAYAGNSAKPAASEAKHYTFGDATSALQAFEIGIFHASNWPYNIKQAGLGGSVNCQYRFYLPQKPTNGERFRFCEHDVFLGGIMWFFEYTAAGFSRADAIELLDALESTIHFGPADNVQTEVSLIRTGYKNFKHPELGLTVYTQEAFITQEEPGTYISTWYATFMGAPYAYVETEVDVVSHEEHLLRVENGTWRTW